jgi:hypothetical protein
MHQPAETLSGNASEPGVTRDMWRKPSGIFTPMKTAYLSIVIAIFAGSPAFAEPRNDTPRALAGC